MKNYLFLPVFLFTSFLSYSQDWIAKMNDPSVNFYEVKKEFYKYWEKAERKAKFKSFFTGQKTEVENESYVHYKRWEYYVEPRVYPTGDRSQLSNIAVELEKLASDPSYYSTRQAGGKWVSLGCAGSPSGGGAGRLNCVRFHPTNSNILYAGAPAGGFWMSTNGGTSWTTTTDKLPTLGVSDIAIDPTNTNVIYIGTGDMDGNDTYGVGVLKSTDGGLTWKMTGLSFSLTQARNVTRIIINPINTNMIWAGTSNGVYRSIDAGATWYRVLPANGIKDLEMKPGDPTTVYASNSTTFYKSTNSGLTFASVTTGLPFASSVSRMTMAVTAADPNYIYIVYANKSDEGFLGVYRSINSGTSFTQQSTSPNLLGWSSSGNDQGGQGWYDLAIAASPVNKNEIVVGGVNIWKSTNGGTSWSINAHWAGGGPYVHADIHDLAYRPNSSTYYASCDGGAYTTSNGGTTWQEKNNGMQIGQMYRLGCSASNANIITQGWQDNGTNLYSSTLWSHINGGDGMETFVDWSNPNNIYASSQNGDLNLSTNGGGFFQGISWSISEPGEWITPWLQHPTNSQTIFAGFQNVWKSTNMGNSWSKISSFNSGGLKALAISKSNPNYIYAVSGSAVYRTTNGGSSWTTLSIPLPGSNLVTYIEVSPTDPQKIWITRSGSTATCKVYRSNDGGTTWINVAYNLPNISVNCVAAQSGTNDPIYVGTDVGVYYIDNTLKSWQPFSNGLPNTIINELEIHVASGKIRAATYGRGLWESTIYNSTSSRPYPNFTASKLSGCPSLVVQFSDSTKNNPTSWLWSFPGGTPNSSTLQNPTVTYNNPGTYNNVKLTVTNASGTDSVIKNSYIAISPNTPPTITLDNNDSVCTGQSVKLTPSTGNSTLWLPGNQTSATLTVTTTGTYSVAVTDAFGCTSTSLPVNIYVLTVSTPVITMSNDTLYSSAPSGNQWYLNSVAISGATNSFYKTNGVTGSYTVKVTNSLGCTSSASAALNVSVDENTSEIDVSVYPNPSDGSIYINMNAANKIDLKINLTDILGKEIYSTSFEGFVGQNIISVDLNENSSGIYFLKIKDSNGGAFFKKIILK